MLGVRSSESPLGAGGCVSRLAFLAATLLLSAIGAPVVGQVVGFPGLDPATADPGSTIYHVRGIRAADHFGRSIAVVGDIDGDGVKDFATSGRDSLPSFDFPFEDAGRVDVLSGKTGERLLRRFGSGFREFFGLIVGALPDIDGDGIYEIGAVNVYGDVFVFSPRTGDDWFMIPRHDEVIADSGEAAFLRVPDQNGDGVEEFVYVEDFATTSFAGFTCSIPGPQCVRGRAQQHCGRTGELMWRYDGQPPDGSVWGCVGPAGDFDGDGVLDVLVPRRRVEPDAGSPLLVLSGGDGRLIDVFHIQDDFETWGVGLLSLGDHDGNGFPEIMISAPKFGFGREEQRGWIGLYHLHDFELAWSFTGRQASDQSFRPGFARGDRLGASLAVAGDIDQDGFLDVLAGTDRSSNQGVRRHAALYLHSGRTGELLTVYEADLDLYLYTLGAGTTDLPFFQQLSPLDDIDGDAFLDFLVGRNLNGPASFGNAREGVVRAVRYRPSGPRFIRGDATGDGRINLADAITIFGGLFGRRAVGCLFAFDANRSAAIDILDGLFVINHVLLPASDHPPPPYPECARYAVVHAFANLGCDDEGSCTR